MTTTMQIVSVCPVQEESKCTVLCWRCQTTFDTNINTRNNVSCPRCGNAWYGKMLMRDYEKRLGSKWFSLEKLVR